MEPNAEEYPADAGIAEWCLRWARANPFFEHLTEAEWRTVTARCQVVCVPKDCHLIVAGGQPTAVYFLCDGSVLAGRVPLLAGIGSVPRSSTSGVVLFSVVLAGRFLGEISVIDGGVRSANVVTREECLCLRWEPEAFLEFLSSNPALLMALLRDSCRLTRHLTNLVETLCLLSIRGRLCWQLLSMAQQFGKSSPDGSTLILLQLKQHHIGAMIGTSRADTSRELNKLATDRLIRLENDRIRVLDMAVLRAIVAAELP